MDKNKLIHFIRKLLADTWLAILVSSMIAIFHEYRIIGLTIMVIVRTRLIATIPRALYGLFRDEFIYLITKKRKDYTKFEYIICNTFSSLLYNGPIYFLILWISRANTTHREQAVCNVIIASIITGVLYGLFLDFFRKLFDITIPRIWKRALDGVFKRK